MDLFRNAKVVRLRSHLDKYLVAEEDEESVIQGRNGSSKNALWTVELMPNSQSDVIYLKSCYNKYLTASNERFLLGATGRKVVQTVEPSLGWEPIGEEGTLVKLKTQDGKFLRANGGLPPWRNSVTHDSPLSSSTHDTICIWDVDVVEIHVVNESGGGMAMEESRKAALAYYDKASPEVKKLAHDFFDSMDTDQDGQVSIDEFVDFFNKIDDSKDRNFFAALAGNGNGCLQFEEVIILLYILITQAQAAQIQQFEESLKARIQHVVQHDAQNESRRKRNAAFLDLMAVLQAAGSVGSPTTLGGPDSCCIM